MIKKSLSTFEREMKNPHFKKAFEKRYKELLLSISNMAKEKALPFEPLIPNKKTITAMRAARRGHLTTVKKLDHLLDSLNESD